jgi:hypothetical protein
MIIMTLAAKVKRPQETVQRMSFSDHLTGAVRPVIHPFAWFFNG